MGNAGLSCCLEAFEQKTPLVYYHTTSGIHEQILHTTPPPQVCRTRFTRFTRFTRSTRFSAIRGVMSRKCWTCKTNIFGRHSEKLSNAPISTKSVWYRRPRGNDYHVVAPLGRACDTQPGLRKILVPSLRAGVVDMRVGEVDGQ